MNVTTVWEKPVASSMDTIASLCTLLRELFYEHVDADGIHVRLDDIRASDRFERFKTQVCLLQQVRVM